MLRHIWRKSPSSPTCKEETRRGTGKHIDKCSNFCCFYQLSLAGRNIEFSPPITDGKKLRKEMPVIIPDRARDRLKGIVGKAVADVHRQPFGQFSLSFFRNAAESD